MSETLPTCFVISPIGANASPERDRSDQVLEYIITPAALACGYTTLRADQLSEPGMITTQIIKHLANDQIVVADLTGGNPNVFYELALRHASGKPCIQIASEGEKLPFDVSPVRTIMFDHRSLRSSAAAREDIERQMRSIQESNAHVDNPVSAALDYEALRLRHFNLPTNSPSFNRHKIREASHGFAKTSFPLEPTRAGLEARAEAGAIAKGDSLGVCLQEAELSSPGLEIWLTVENLGIQAQRWFGCTLTAYASPVYAEIQPATDVGAANSLIDLYPGEQFTCYYWFPFGPQVRGPKFLTCKSWDKDLSFWWARGA